jgi:MFS family permease
LVFCRLGDLIGRKYTFLLTLVLMGGSTFLIGLVPGYATIGWAAPILVLILRLVQGLALGGEYGGAATYVAEHAPKGRRGFYTSWIQTTATLGLFLALGVIILIRNAQGVETFSSEWGGWRYPFWISLLLVIVSIFIRMKMSESPVFSKLKKEGKTSTNPLKESFGHKANFKMVLLALFGAVMGQGVIWYTGQFYAQNFLETVCKIDFLQSRNIMIIAILFATPFFVVFGGLSDKIGRKWIMMTGMFLGIFSYMFIYEKFLEYTNTGERIELIDKSGIKVGTSEAFYDAKHPERILVKTNHDTGYTDGSIFKYTKTDTLKIAGAFTPGLQLIFYKHPVSGEEKTVAMHARPKEKLQVGVTKLQLNSISNKPGSTVEKTMGKTIYWKIIFLVFLQILFVTMVYGPIAAFLVELFPTKIRYTSMSLPYHIGNGIFGGLVPFLATLIVEFTKSAEHPDGNPLAGLYYPIGVAAVCFIIGSVYLSNKIDEDVND